MANSSFKVFSETDLFSTSAYSSVHEENYSWRYLAKTYFNNSKSLKNSISNVFLKENSFVNYYKNLPGAMPISINQMLKTQNTNAPWLLNVLKNKFRKQKNNRGYSKNSSIGLAEELLEKPISTDGLSGKWIINEKEVVFPLMKNFDTSTSGQYNVSHAISSSTTRVPLSTDDSLHFHHYDFQTINTPTTSFLVDHQPQISSIITEDTEQKISNDDDIPVDFSSIACAVKTYYTTSRPQIDSNNIQEMEISSPTLESITEDVHLISGNSTSSKRAKSASAARSRRRPVSSSSTKRGKERSKSTKKKKSKYYQEHFLSSEEIELREALRIIDLDNIGFFSPNELRKILKEIGISSHDIDKIERCLPLDEDGHYSIDNLIKLFLATK